MAGGRLFCVVVCATTIVLGAFAAPANASHPGLAVGDMFAPDSFVEKPLADDAPLDRNSTTMIAMLVAELQAELASPDITDRPTVDNQWCSPRVYTVPATQPYVDVTLPATASQLVRQQIGRVPIPPYASTYAGCTDRPLVIHQPSTDKLWELWIAHKDSGSWQAEYGGLITPENGMRGVSQNPGHWEAPPNGFGLRFGATATSIVKLGGLSRISELQAGVVDHTLRLGLKAPAPCWRWPAQRMDGWTTLNHPEKAPNGALNNPLAPPYGAILRLPASLDIDALNLPRFTETMAKAAQRHGMVVSDRSNQLGFITEVAPRILGVPGHENDPDPYPQIFEGRSRYDLARLFPWDKLQVLAVRPGHSECHWE
jgi:hypothetical protein